MTVAKRKYTRKASPAPLSLGEEQERTLRNFPDAKPIRARESRMEATQTTRRRRRLGSLNRMAQYKLDIFEADQLDLDNYVYRWVTDDGSRLRQVTKMDDYDFVNASEIEGFNPEDESDSEGGERVRMIVGQQKNGNPIHQYLLKKRKEFWEEDNRLGQDFRDDVLAGRVYQGDAEDIGARTVAKDGSIKSVGPEHGVDLSNVYVPPEATLNHGLSDQGRRRGLVQPQQGA